MGGRIYRQIQHVVIISTVDSRDLFGIVHYNLTAYEALPLDMLVAKMFERQLCQINGSAKTKTDLHIQNQVRYSLYERVDTLLFIIK